MIKATLLLVALSFCLSAQFTPPPSGGGSLPVGTGNCVVASPANGSSGTVACRAAVAADIPPLIQLNSGTVKIYPTEIANPAALVVTPVGTANATSYGYKIMLSLGANLDGSPFSTTAGSDVSPETTCISNSTLSSSNYCHIVLPVEADPNISCIVVRTSGPVSPQIIFFGTCGGPGGGADGMGNVDDQANGAITPLILLDTGNTTAGTLVYQNPLGGSSTIANREGSSGLFAGGLQAPVPTAGSVANFAPSTYFNYSGHFISPVGWVANAYRCYAPFNCERWDIAYAGPAWSVTKVDNTNSPYTILRSDGFLRVDTSAGARTVTLPDPTTDENFPQGRTYFIHKADVTTDNAVTVTPSAGTTINGLASYVITCKGGSVIVYAEGYAGTADNWPTISREPLCGTTSAIGGGALLAGACTTPVTVTVTGARSWMTALASEVSDTGDGAYAKAWVSADDTVSVKVCEPVAGTPASLVYNVRVIQ